LRGVNGDTGTVAAVDSMIRGMDELDEPLRDAREAADRVRQIVKDLRIFSRSDEESRRPVDVHRVMESTLRMAWNEIRHRARLVKNYGDIPMVEASESRLGQVFLNLIVNAAQAIPEGDTGRQEIRVTTSCYQGAIGWPSRCATPAAASRRRCGRRSSIRSSPPNRPAWAPAWAWPSATGSSWR